MARGYAGGHTLPENPQWLEFPRSDGDTKALPKNTQKVVDSDGQVNFMRPTDLDESLAINWRVGVGSQLAARMGLPVGPNYVLKAFPDGYQLYDHNKGPVKNPRHDPYLCGSTNVNRFRSINEFIPHALWLMQDATLNRGNCSCKYCTKQPQRIISDSMGLSTHGARRSMSIAGALPPSNKAPRMRREPREAKQNRVPPKPYAAVRRAPKPIRTLVGPEQYILPERDLDIRAALVLGENSRPRWFRKGELLWCHLEPPIRGRGEEEEDIQFWPGLVEDVHVKTQAVPYVSVNGTQRSNEASMDHLYQEVADGDLESDTLANGSSTAGHSDSTKLPLEAEGNVPWRVQQWYVYKMKLLGTAHHCFVTDEQVLPYLAYAPSDRLLGCVREELAKFLQNVPIDQMDRDTELMSTFDPMEVAPEDGDGRAAKYRRAAAPYTLALQIAANVAQYWLPTDEWDCKFTIPPPAPAPSTSSELPPPSASQGPQLPSSQTPPPPPPEAMSLHALITQSLSQNAQSTVISQSESISTHARLPRSQTVMQTRFQGLWWGTERIWADELVRLKIARCQFAPKGTETIYPPAGPSASTLEIMQGNPEVADADTQRLGASEKGLFLKLEGLFVVDVPNQDGLGFAKECRASGMVYELADDDWVDQASTSDAMDVDRPSKGKGKERADQASNGDPTVTQGATGALAFMDQPSPMKPPPLPNPDPSVPVGDTAAVMLAQTSPEAAAKNKEAPGFNAQLSHPVLSTPYPLPPATKGFVFRPILPPDHEVVVSLSLISGRYYPGLFHHPLMAPTVAHALSLSVDDGGLYNHRHLWAMEGLLPGIHQSMDPRQWRKSRLAMLQDADADARARFKERWEETKMTRLIPPQTQDEDSNNADHAPMEVD
ncbi:hypothetical protein C8Q79DRAFT_1113372 [Trametes meyenii]|nr:hypothetical protein C8Q79DRAFT_1113372 [Trametes meyenii]